jgi:hypothetical protein
MPTLHLPVKESLKLRDDILQNVKHPDIQRAANFLALCGSLIERYTCEELSLHLHLSGSDRGSDLCILVKAANRAMRPQFAVDLDSTHIVGSGATEHGEWNPSVAYSCLRCRQ